MNGGQANGVAVDALTFLVRTLAERYAPLGEETRLRAMTDLFNFDRRHGESVDDLLTRFDVTRKFATQEGGVGVNVQALNWFLLKAARPSDQRLPQLLQPFDQR